MVANSLALIWLNESNTNQWRIQDFPEEGAPTLRGGGGRRDTILLKFPENCMKLKKIRPPGGVGGARLLRSATENVNILSLKHFQLICPRNT